MSTKPPYLDSETLRWLDDVESSAPGEVAQLAAPVLADEGYSQDEAKAILDYWQWHDDDQR